MTSDAAIGVGAIGGFVMQLWEVFWTAAMSFPSYGVMYVVLGLCAGLNHHVEDKETTGESLDIAATHYPVAAGHGRWQRALGSPEAV